MLFSKSDELQNVFGHVTTLTAAYTANGCIVESVSTHLKPDQRIQIQIRVWKQTHRRSISLNPSECEPFLTDGCSLGDAGRMLAPPGQHSTTPGRTRRQLWPQIFTILHICHLFHRLNFQDKIGPVLAPLGDLGDCGCSIENIVRDKERSEELRAMKKCAAMCSHAAYT